MRALIAILFVSVFAAPASAQAIDGSLHCNAVCRAWMNLSAPADDAASGLIGSRKSLRRSSVPTGKRPIERATAIVVPLPQPRPEIDSSSVAAVPKPEDGTANVSIATPSQSPSSEAAPSLENPESGEPLVGEAPQTPAENDADKAGDVVASIPTSPPELKEAEERSKDNSGSTFAVVYLNASYGEIAEVIGPIALDETYRNLANKIEASLKAAGARDPSLSLSRELALDRLLDDSVSAAVAGVVPGDVAELYPEVPGYRKIRILISP